MKRKIIKIDEEKCDGCGICIPECKEGALRIIDGKARLISELFCDGLGSCVGECPQGAITVEERDAEAYDEKLVIESMLDKPRSVLKAHLEHLNDHGADEYLSEAIAYLESKGIDYPLEKKILPVLSHEEPAHPCGCPGSAARELKTASVPKNGSSKMERESQLSHWPVQLHLINPAAPYFKGKELVITSTCAPVAFASYHDVYLKNRAVVLACPKLDYTEPYVEKLAALFKQSETIKAIVLRMQVPCCGGLTKIAELAAEQSGRDDLILEEHTISVEGKLSRIDLIHSL